MVDTTAKDDVADITTKDKGLTDGNGLTNGNGLPMVMVLLTVVVLHTGLEGRIPYKFGSRMFQISQNSR